MRILLIHPIKSSLGIWEYSILQNLKHMGHIVTSIDYRNIFNINIISKVLRKFMIYKIFLRNSIINAIEKVKPNFILVSKGELLSPDILYTIKRKYSIPLVNWISDGMWVYNFIINVISYYDIFFTFDSETVKQVKNSGYNNIHYLPLGFDTLLPRNFKPRNMKYYISDICMIGSPTSERINVLTNLDSKFYKNLKIWGPSNWYNTPLKKFYQGRLLKGSEMYYTFKKAKIVLNVHYGFEIPTVPYYSGINHRIFEAGGVGAFILSNYQKDMSKTFETFLPTYKTINELNSQISFYLQRKKLRKEIAKSFRKEILTHHTLLHRLEVIIKKVKKL